MSERAQPTFFKTIGGEDVEIPVRGKHYVKPKGYAARPGTGPNGETCGTCKHDIAFEQSKRWHKCAMAQGKWTGGRGSDILTRSPACSFWEREQEP